MKIKEQNKINRNLTTSVVGLVMQTSGEMKAIQNLVGYHKIYNSYDTQNYQYYKTLKNIDIDSFEQKLLKYHFLQENYIHNQVKTYISPYGFPMYIASQYPLEKIIQNSIFPGQLRNDSYGDKNIRKNGFTFIKKEKNEYLYYIPSDPKGLMFKNHSTIWQN
jgi:hypothetical protein